MSQKIATLSVERELNDGLQIVEYKIGNGDIHFHSNIEICIVEDGSVEALVNDSKKILKRGDVAISLSYDSHSYVSGDDARYSVLLLPDDICDKFYAVMQAKKLASPFLCDAECGTRIIDYLLQIKSDSANEFLRIGGVYLLLGLIKERLLVETFTDNADSVLLSRLLLYIHKNYNKKITLASISKAFGYHPSYISSYFKAGVNLSIVRYINVIRLKNAILLMQHKKHTVTQIAMDCGFSSTRTFYRVFRQEFGCSPKEYKEKFS